MKKSIVSLLVVFALSLTAGSAGAKSPDAALFEQPALITAAGQSADGKLADVLFKRAGVEHTLNPMAKPEDLTTFKTLVLVIGGSSKGLGAAGINATDEEARVTALTAEARKKGIKIMAMHIGGDNRRGDLTDRYIAPCLSDAEYAVVVKAGDKDGRFAKDMENKFFDYAEKIADVAPLVKKAFR